MTMLVEMGVGLESFEKRATAFGRFNACPEMSGRAHIHTMRVGDGLDGTGTGTGTWGEWGLGECEGE